MVSEPKGKRALEEPILVDRPPHKTMPPAFMSGLRYIPLRLVFSNEIPDQKLRID
jgi:hypothetical protein